MTNWIWRLIGFVGGLSFITTGFHVLTDPNCSSVSLSGIRLITTTCHEDSSGFLPAWLGGSVSIIVGVGLMIWAVFPLIEPTLLRNIERNSQEIERQRLLKAEGSATQTPLDDAQRLENAAVEDAVMPLAHGPAKKNPFHGKPVVIAIAGISALIFVMLIVHPWSSKSPRNEVAAPVVVTSQASSICYLPNDASVGYPCSTYPKFSVGFCFAFRYIAFRNETDPSNKTDFIYDPGNRPYWTGILDSSKCPNPATPYAFQITHNVSLSHGTYLFVEYAFAANPELKSTPLKGSQSWSVSVS